MKRVWVILVLMMLLPGCKGAETFETVSDDLVQSVMAQPKEIRLTLPEDTVMPAMESESGTLYMCNGYDVTVQTLEGGDLNSTIRQVCGYDREALTVMETESGDFTCYEFVWTGAGELGQQVGRAAILDDGSYHYVLTAVTAEADAEEYREIWNGMFETFGIG